MRLAQLLNKTVKTVTYLNSVLYELPKNRTDGSALLCGTAGGCRQSPGAAPLPTRQLREGATLYWVENPLNNMFTLRWRFQTGRGHDLNLLMLDDWMQYGGCDTLDYQALKKALPELLTLLNQKMSLPTLSEKERTAVINSRKSEKKLITREPRMKQNILSEFVRMGDQSIYLVVPSQQNRLEDELGAKIFSRYFSQGMSSLVFQEIREFRSLAYATGGNYSLYADRSAPGWYMGYMTTQADRVDFALVRDFHERYIKGQPQVIIITGNRKKIDLAAIEKLYGPVVEHKFKDIYRE